MRNGRITIIRQGTAVGWFHGDIAPVDRDDVGITNAPHVGDTKIEAGIVPDGFGAFRQVLQEGSGVEGRAEVYRRIEDRDRMDTALAFGHVHIGRRFALFREHDDMAVDLGF